jgi:hypothetical protein
MIADRRALSVTVDGDDCVITYEGDPAPVGSAQLLLDARGKLVGVDLGAAGFDRVAVMIGAHEAVAETRPARVSALEKGASIRVHGARTLVP